MQRWHDVYNASFRPARSHKEAEFYEIPEAAKYRKERDSWLRHNYETHLKQGARFAVRIHSTERGDMPDNNFLDPNRRDRIDLEVLYHDKARRMPKMVRSYKPMFFGEFPESTIYFGPQGLSHSEMTVVELYNDPQYVMLAKAEKMVRHFIGYMVWAVQHWNQLQEDFKA